MLAMHCVINVRELDTGFLKILKTNMAVFWIHYFKILEPESSHHNITKLD